MKVHSRALFLRRGACLLLIFLIGSLSSCAPAPLLPVNPPLSTIRVVMDNNYPPYVFAGDQGNVQGILVDQWKLWEARTGVKIELIALPWSEALQRMQAGEFDVIDTIFYTDERAKIFDFTPAYALIAVPIFFQKNISGIADAGDLKGFRVAVKRGDANADYLIQQGITDLIYYNSCEEIIQAAARKEQVIFVIDQPPALYFLYKYGLQDQFNHSALLYSAEFHRAVQKGNPALLNLVTTGFSAISAEDYRAIDQRWLGTGESAGWSANMPYVAAGIVVVLLIILVLVVFSRTLQKRVWKRTRELEETAEALHDSRRFLADLIETGGALIYVKDRDGRYELVNRKYEEVTRLNRANVLGKTDEVLFPGLIGQQFRANDLEVLEAGIVLEREEILGDARGKRYFISIKFPVRGDDGHIKGVCGMTTEITERKQAEEALRQSEDKFSKAFHTSPDSVNINRLSDGLYFEINAGFTAITGYTAADVSGKTSLEINIWADPADRARLVQGLQERGQVTNLEAEFRMKDGRLITALMSAAVIEVAGEKCILTITRDITERKQVEDEIRWLNEDLEQRVTDRTHELAAANARLTELDQLKSKFVSDVSHELRTPIANLKLYIDLLERGKPDKQSQYISVLHQQVRRVAALVDDILDLSRLERRKEQGVIYRAVALNEVVEQVVLAHQPRAEADGLILTFEPASLLPSVRADANQLAQVVTNLIANALSYTAAGTVRIRTYAEDDQVCLCVADSGSGIAPDDLPHVFERFYRGQHVLKNDIPGTGLGLAIIKEIVDLHEGRIEVDSQPGRGTTFQVWLPVAR